MSNLRSHFYLLFISLIFCHGKKCLQETRAALYIFGDSGFDAGNNNYINTTFVFQANRWPYGETFFKYPTGRFSDGRLVPDFVAEYANLPLIEPYLLPGYHRYTDGANFASAGSGVLTETFQGFVCGHINIPNDSIIEEFVVDLETQLSYFAKMDKLLRQKIGDSETKRLMSRSVFLFSVGNNDYRAYTLNLTTLRSYSNLDYVNLVIGNLTSVIQEVYKRGGRKFGFRNVGPLGCIPSMRALHAEGTRACFEEANAIVELHNKALSVMLQQLQNQLQGFKYSIADFYTFLSKIINNPLKYGFKEGMVACCGSGPYNGDSTCGEVIAGKVQFELCNNVNDYVFFDANHPTEKVNQMLSNLWWGGTGSPYNLEVLFEF